MHFFVFFYRAMGVYFLYSCLAFVIQHVIKIMHSKVTHTLMESCCVEEFLPSAAIEGIWGFTRAIAMVGGVSLVIFFSLCKWMDSKLSAIGMQTVNIFHKHKNPLPLRLLCFLTDLPTIMFVKQ